MCWTLNLNGRFHGVQNGLNFMGIKKIVNIYAEYFLPRSNTKCISGLLDL